MSDDNQHAEAIAAEMARVRAIIQRDVHNVVGQTQEVVQHAKQLVDWRYQLGRHTWLVAAAMAVGTYYLLPRRTTPAPQSMAELQPRVGAIAGDLESRGGRRKTSPWRAARDAFVSTCLRQLTQVALMQVIHVLSANAHAPAQDTDRKQGEEFASRASLRQQAPARSEFVRGGGTT